MDKFLQLLVGGVALGSIYALVALGFVVVYTATRTFNFSQGGMVLMGAYLTYQFGDDWGAPFVLAIAAAMATMALGAALIERVAIRPLVGRPPFVIVLVTLGVLVVIEQVVRSTWTQPALVMTTPWGNDASRLGNVTIRHVDFYTVAITILLVLGFVWFYRHSRTGLAMRAAALDQEVAAANGVSLGRVTGLAWAIAAMLGVVAGVMLTSRGGSALSPGLGFIALRAFPAMILGGFDSTSGAVAGGLVIGVAEVMAQGYLTQDFLGSGIEEVVPYVLMVIVLLWRPTGFFGSRTVTRV
jgi:branched-chain amino acid transport system permease protein